MSEAPPTTGPHVIFLRNAMEKASWLDNAASLDAATPIVRCAAQLLASDTRPRAELDRLARAIARKVRESEADVSPETIAARLVQQPHGRDQQIEPLGILCERLQRWVRDVIAYVRDWGGREEFADSRTIIRRGFDDCDGKSRLYVALVRGLHIAGLRARIRPIVTPRKLEFVHVQAEVHFPGSEKDSRSFDGGWLLAELILAGVELGENPVAVGRKDAAGSYVLAGPPSAGLFDPNGEHG
jgi:hypothetical protein